MSPFGIALSVAVLWQILFTVFGVFVDTTTHNIFERVDGANGLGLFAHTLHWDAGWYQYIVNGGYLDPESASPVFYPLFPTLVIIITTISFNLISVPVAGLLVNTIALFVALLSLYRIAQFFVPTKYTWYVPALFLTSPAALFLHMFYTEAIFCAIAFTAYLLALQRKWLLMGITLGALTATRLPALLFIGLCGLEFLRAHNWSVRGILNKNILVFLFAPLGFITYGMFLAFTRGDFMAMFNSYDKTTDWAYQVFNPNIFETLEKGSHKLYQVFTTGIPFDEGQAVNYFLPISGLLVLFAASVYLAINKQQKRLGTPLAIFGVFAIILFTMNSNFVSIHRYLLPCLGIYLALAHFSTLRKETLWLIPLCIYVGVLLQAYLLIFFVNGYFAG
jgi:hypothetical protein